MNSRAMTNFWFALLAALALLTGCGREEGSGDELVIRYQSTPNTVQLLELAEDLGYLGDLKLDYRGGALGGPENLQALISGDVDVASAFNGAHVKLAATGVDLVSLVASYGSVKGETERSFYVLADSPIRGARDFIGKKVATNSLGAHIEVVLKEYLRRGGLTPQEIAQVELVVLPPVNVEQTLRNGQIDVGSFGEIFRYRLEEKGGVREIFADVDLFGPFTAGYYVTTRKFYERHPEAAAAFVAGVARTIEWARVTPREEVVGAQTAIIERRQRGETTAVVKYWRGVGIPAKGGLVDAREYQRWADWYAETGELPANKVDVARLAGDNRYNPYRDDAPPSPTGQETKP